MYKKWQTQLMSSVPHEHLMPSCAAIHLLRHSAADRLLFP